MSIQSLGSYSPAQESQLLLGGGTDSSGLTGLPQLSSEQLQQLRQAIAQDVQQALSGGNSASNGASPSGGSSSGNSSGSSSGASDFQSRLDQNISNTLSQFGFSDSQTQTVLDKLNQALSGRANGSGNAQTQPAHVVRRHLRHAMHAIFQALQNASSGRGASGFSSDLTGSSSSTLFGASAGGANVDSASSGQSLDLTA